MRLNDNVRPAGQTAGFLGAQWDPDRFIGDPSADDYQVEGLGLQPGISPLRLESRLSLFEQVGRHFDALERGQRRARLRRHSPGRLRAAHLGPGAATLSKSAKSPIGSASATARIAGDSACCWPGG